MKRVLAGVLTLVMLLCCMPAMAHAAGTDDQVKCINCDNYIDR